MLLVVNFTGRLRTICHCWPAGGTRQWNQRHLLLHPRTCLEIRKLIRKEVPSRVDVIMSAATESCQTTSGDGDVPADHHSDIVQSIYNEVSAGGFLGKSLFELQVCYCLILAE